MGRVPPLPVRRELRQEVNFGCPVCGAPILEYHHIVPYSEVEEHDPDRMVALCPNHHREADNGAISRSTLYDYKEDPYISDIVEYPFRPETTSPIIPLGSVYVEIASEGEYIPLQISGEPIFTLNYTEGRLEFDINFYDSDNQLIATMTNNEWWANTGEYWDIVFQGHKLKLWNEFREIGFEADFDPDESVISFKGRFLYNGEECIIHPKSVKIPQLRSQISGGHFIIGGSEDYESRFDYPGASVKADFARGLFAIGEAKEEFVFSM